MAESLAVLVTKPPYGTEEAFAGMREALALLVSGLMDRSVVLMVGEGTLNAVSVQDPLALNMPSNLEAVEDLLALDGEVYAVNEDLEELMPGVEIVEGVERISWDRAREILDEMDVINTF